MKTLRIHSATYAEIMEHLNNDKKIAAIKSLRRDRDCGLREAKEAIERLQGEKFGKNYPQAMKEGAVLIVGPIIKKMILNFGEGDIEVDLETMQMMGLMEMQKIGLDACGDILDLVEALQAFANGKKIGVIDECG